MPALAYIFPTSIGDKASPPSVVGAVSLVTDNGSRAIALGGEVYFKQNTYRTTGIYARGNLNYDLYGIGSGDSQLKLPLKQTGQVVFGEFLRRTWWKVFLGPRFLWGSSLITLRPNITGTEGNQPFRTKNFLPSAGGGVRFELSKQYHVNFRVDFAQGKDSHTWSVGVGEAF